MSIERKNLKEMTTGAFASYYCHLAFDGFFWLLGKKKHMKTWGFAAKKEDKCKCDGQNFYQLFSVQKEQTNTKKQK